MELQAFNYDMIHQYPSDAEIDDQLVHSNNANYYRELLRDFACSIKKITERETEAVVQFINLVKFKQGNGYQMPDYEIDYLNYLFHMLSYDKRIYPKKADIEYVKSTSNYFTLIKFTIWLRSKKSTKPKKLICVSPGLFIIRKQTLFDEFIEMHQTPQQKFKLINYEI